jgi:hypothetical protein
LQAGQYGVETDAKAKCGSETVVWVNFSSKVFHYAGYKDYGKTKRGAYMCKTAAEKSGFRAAKSEKPGASFEPNLEASLRPCERRR